MTQNVDIRTISAAGVGPDASTGWCDSPIGRATSFFLAALSVRLLFSFFVVPLAGINMGPATRGFYASCDGYVRLAENLVDHHRLSFQPDAPPTVFRSPAFPAAVALMYLLVGHVGFALVVTNCLASAITVAIVYLLAERFYDRRIAWWSGLAATFYPLAVHYTAHGFADPFLAMAVAAYFYGTICIMQQPRVWKGVLLGLVLGTGVLTKSVMLPLAFVFVCIALVKRRDMLWPAVVSLAVGGMIVGGWTTRNYAVTHRFIPVTVGAGYNLLVGNMMADVKGNADDVYDTGVIRARERFERDHGRPLGGEQLLPHGYYDLSFETDAMCADSAWRVLREDPALMIRKTLVNLSRFWWLSTSTTRSVANAVVNGAVVVLALLGLWRVRRDRPLETLWLALFAGGYVGIYAMVIVSSSRFCLPIIALLLPFATATLIGALGARPIADS